MKKIELSTKGTKHKNKYFALVDDDDYLFLSTYSWALHSSKKRVVKYAITRINGKTILMHKMILTLKDKIIDHKDRNGLNNQRSNLRYVTHSINMQNSKTRSNNSSGFTGVDYRADKKKFRGRIGLSFIGYFNSPIEAAKAYNQKAVEIYGINARLNNV